MAVHRWDCSQLSAWLVPALWRAVKVACLYRRGAFDGVGTAPLHVGVVDRRVCVWRAHGVYPSRASAFSALGCVCAQHDTRFASEAALAVVFLALMLRMLRG